MNTHCRLSLAVLLAFSAAARAATFTVTTAAPAAWRLALKPGSPARNAAVGSTAKLWPAAHTSYRPPPDLADPWTNYGGPTAGTGGNVTLPVIVAGLTRYFFRMSVDGPWGWEVGRHVLMPPPPAWRCL